MRNLLDPTAQARGVLTLPHGLSRTELAAISDLEQRVLAVDGAYRLRSTQPVTVYQFNPLNADVTNDASLMLPVNTWTGNYLVAAWPTWIFAGQPYPGLYAVVGKEDGTKVTIRPLAGTRPRGATPALDKALEQELSTDPKERAEHLMLIDLARNDIGRIAARNMGQQRAVGRVVQRQRLTRFARAPGAADKDLGGVEINFAAHGSVLFGGRPGLGHHISLVSSFGPFLVKRLATFLATLVVASLVVFAVLELLPGNAAEVILGDTATPESLAALNAKLGLDQPGVTRYANWVGGLLRGDTARSISYDTPTAELIVERLRVTLPLALMAMLLAVVLALSLGVYAASRHNRLGDVGVMAASQIGIAIPNFWFAILLILLFAVKLQWVSAGGFPGWTEDDGGGLWAGLRALILPAVALALVQAAILARVTRSAVIDVMREDFVRTARAKGLSRRQALWRHVLRNAMIPVLTVAGLQFANLITGTIVVENVFVLPGIGRLVFQAISNRDLIVVRDVVMLLAAVVVFVNFIVDVLYAVIDPRLRTE